MNIEEANRGEVSFDGNITTVVNFELLANVVTLIYVVFAVASPLLLLVWRARDPVAMTYNPGGLHARVSRVKIIVRPLAALTTS